jgi:hypothetical protein
MRFYSGSEIDLLIEDVSGIAKEAIEKAAGEAARAAMIAGLEREALALREAALQQAEALKWRLKTESLARDIKLAKRAGIKNAVIAGAVCLFGGIAAGMGGALIIGGR